MPVIEVEGLTRRYTARQGIRRRTTKDVEAVRGIDFHVEAGELFGLLGLNGAGKTTTIKMLITLLLPSGGSSEGPVGLDVVAEPREVRRRVGYVFGGDRGLYERLSGLDNLRDFAELYGVSPREQPTRIDELLEVVGLTGRECERVEGYSRGMRQRLHIARGLLHRPDVLLPRRAQHRHRPGGRARVARPPSPLSRPAGTTVLLTTHYMFEADELCDRIAVIAGGRIVAEGTPDELKRAVTAGTVVEVEAYGVEGPEIAAIEALPGVHSVDVEIQGQAQLVVARSVPGAEITSAVLQQLGSVRVGRVSTREPSLEDAYVELVRNA